MNIRRFWKWYVIVIVALWMLMIVTGIARSFPIIY